MNYKLELTEEELNFIYDRCFNKAARLEDIGLDDTPCYRIAHQIMHKIYLTKNNTELIKTAAESFWEVKSVKKEEVVK